MFATLPIIFKATLEKIEKNLYGIIFLVINKHELIGVFTDGDAHRALLDSSNRVVDFSTPARVRRFPILELDIGEQEINNALECVTTGWRSSQGEFIGEFERAFSSYLGSGHAIAVTNGAVVLQLASTSMGVDWESEFENMINESNYIHISDNDGFHDLNNQLSKSSSLSSMLRQSDTKNKDFTSEICDEMNAIKKSYDVLLGVVL